MEKSLNQQICEQQQKLLREFDILERLSMLFSLLLIAALFSDIGYKGILLSVLIAIIPIYKIIVWQRKKEINTCVNILENNIRFLENKKEEYIKLTRTAIKGKTRSTKSLLEKSSYDLEIDYLSKKIQSLQEEIQQTKYWIEHFKKLG